MKIHLAGANSFKEVIINNRVPHTLFSYIDLKRREDLHEYLEMYDFCKKIIIDSGAYSVWAAGKSIDIDEYIAFCLGLQNSPGGDRFIFVNLDTLPGKKDTKPTPQEREYSAQKSWESMLYMHGKGVRCLPVFHQHEDMSWMHKMAEFTDYIGISPDNSRDNAPKYKKGWLDMVYYQLRLKAKTHGFGVTSKEILMRYPFYSVDSTSWIDPKKYGHSLTTNLKTRGLKRQHGQGIEGKHGKVMLWELDNEVKRWLELEKMLTKSWEARGIAWT
jgi:hypothetical protein